MTLFLVSPSLDVQPRRIAHSLHAALRIANEMAATRLPGWINIYSSDGLRLAHPVAVIYRP